MRALGIKVVEHATELNMHEMNPVRLTALRKELLGDVELPVVTRADAGLPTRPPVLCAGCGHRSVFYTLAVGRDRYGRHRMLHAGAFPPLNAMDTTICMGGLRRQCLRYGESR